MILRLAIVIFAVALVAGCESFHIPCPCGAQTGP
jgi:hypothetical protein